MRDAILTSSHKSTMRLPSDEASVAQVPDVPDSPVARRCSKLCTHLTPPKSPDTRRLGRIRGRPRCKLLVPGQATTDCQRAQVEAHRPAGFDNCPLFFRSHTPLASAVPYSYNQLRTRHAHSNSFITLTTAPDAVRPYLARAHPTSSDAPEAQLVPEPRPDSLPLPLVLQRMPPLPRFPTQPSTSTSAAVAGRRPRRLSPVASGS